MSCSVQESPTLTSAECKYMLWGIITAPIMPTAWRSSLDPQPSQYGKNIPLSNSPWFGALSPYYKKQIYSSVLKCQFSAQESQEIVIYSMHKTLKWRNTNLFLNYAFIVHDNIVLLLKCLYLFQDD